MNILSIRRTFHSFFLLLIVSNLVHKMTSSDPNEEVQGNAFPSTDFRQFIDAILEANSCSNRIVQRVALLRPLDDVSKIVHEEYVQHAIVVLEQLTEERRDLNSHYGWALASDSELVYKSMGGKSDRGTAWAKKWVRRVFDEYERLGRALVDAKLELEGILPRETRVQEV